MLDGTDFNKDCRIFRLKERAIHKQLNGLCNIAHASAQLIISLIRSIQLHLNLKISCKGRQFNVPATAKKSLISNVGTMVQMKESRSTYVHFHGNALHLHAASEITGLRMPLETAYEPATFKSSRCCTSGHVMWIYSGEQWLVVPCAHQTSRFSECFLKIRP